MSGYTQNERDDIQAKWSLRFPPDPVALYRERRRVIAESFDRPEPKLVPAFGHRYIPEAPHEAWPPVKDIPFWSRAVELNNGGP
jgi:hypothetical protein